MKNGFCDTGAAEVTKLPVTGTVGAPKLLDRIRASRRANRSTFCFSMTSIRATADKSEESPAEGVLSLLARLALALAEEPTLEAPLAVDSTDLLLLRFSRLDFYLLVDPS